MNIDIDALRATAMICGGLSLILLLLAGVLFILAYRAMRSISVPDGSGFSETLLYTPLMVVLFIDVLDMALDFLAAPLAWMILDYFGLHALRGLAAVEALIPGTQFIPTLTICWIGVRLLGHQKGGLSSINNLNF